MDNAQKLTQWLQDNRYSKAAFADLVGTTRPTMSKLCHGHSKPNSVMAKMIERATEGAVVGSEW